MSKRLFLVLLLTIGMTSMCTTKRIHFGNESWEVKVTDQVHGPGLNLWGNANVIQKSTEGVLFKINEFQKQVNCSEIKSNKKDYGYGTYVFHLKGDLDKLEKNTVFGIFLYENVKDSPLEIDIEFSRWNDSKKKNLHYTIHNFSGHKNKPVSKEFSQTDENTTCIIHWTEEALYLGTFSGHIQFDHEQLKEMQRFQIKQKDKKSNFRIHINYWKLPKSEPEYDNHEILLKKFKYSPIK